MEEPLSSYWNAPWYIWSSRFVTSLFKSVDFSKFKYRATHALCYFSWIIFRYLSVRSTPFHLLVSINHVKQITRTNAENWDVGNSFECCCSSHRNLIPPWRISERESFRHETSPSARWRTKRRGRRTRMKTEGGIKDFETMEDREDELPRKNFEFFAL